jgi:hypothetical protein
VSRSGENPVSVVTGRKAGAPRRGEECREEDHSEHANQAAPIPDRPASASPGSETGPGRLWAGCCGLLGPAGADRWPGRRWSMKKLVVYFNDHGSDGLADQLVETVIRAVDDQMVGWNLLDVEGMGEGGSQH